MKGQRRSREWRDGLILTKADAPCAVLANAMHAFRKAPEWRGVLGYNEFTGEVVVRNSPPWDQDRGHWFEKPWSDRFDALAAEWLQKNGIMVTHGLAGTAAATVAREAPFHPVREYLEGLEWDRVPRLDSWLSRYLGAPDSRYSQAVGARWLISAVARIFEPGCKADSALILEGPQGIGKSSAIKALADPWTTDRLSDFTNKDAYMELQGVWLVELSELDTIRTADIATIKAFMSRTEDRFRAPYARHVENHPRQCVFVGSVNPISGYLKDPTGARRFLPVFCTAIDLAGLRRDREALWAEAVERYRAGEPWWLDTPQLQEIAAEEQSDRYEPDPWEATIEKYVAKRDQVTIDEVLWQACGVEKTHWTQSLANRVAHSLKRLGFERARSSKGADGKRTWCYRRTPAPPY